ncbi:MAG: Sec-independent protein translocase protein TatB [Nevskiales bacterium]|nr:Sec-independent protein translocase protein TatB [Nevskiales bacterium]
MFDVSFTELVLCFVVALVVLGPQKLPAVARTLGQWTGRARVYVRQLTAEWEREIQADALPRELQDVGKLIRDEAQSVEDRVRTSLEAPASRAESEARKDPPP